MPIITTDDGAGIAVEDSGGAGPPVLLVGGWTMSTPWWHRQAAGLAPGLRVVAMDPRAYGRSTKVAHGHRMSRHAADVRDVLRALDLHDVTAVGWSSGANVLLAHWELFRGERIARLVHVDQSPRCLDGDGWTLGFGSPAAAEEFLAGFAADPDAAAAELVDAMFVTPPSAQDRAWMVEAMRQTPVAAALAFERDHLAADWRDVVPTVALPVLVVTGAQSRIFPPASGRWLADHLPDARHVVLADSGHCPFLEEPERFNELLSDFITTAR